MNGIILNYCVYKYTDPSDFYYFLKLHNISIIGALVCYKDGKVECKPFPVEYENLKYGQRCSPNTKHTYQYPFCYDIKSDGGDSLWNYCDNCGDGKPLHVTI